MTREEKLEKAAIKYAQGKYLPVQTAQSFKAGVKWADENPKEGLVDIDKACKWLKKWDAYRVCLEGHKDWFIEQFKKAMEE